MPDGPDVGELTQDLIALGFGAGLTPGNHFSQATANAVERWQASLGLDQTGVVRLGEAVFEPGPIRVSAVHATVGGGASPGPVLDATSTNRVVTVALSVSQEYLVHAGDAVSVVLPDGKTTTPGHVRDVSTVATTPSGGGNGNSTPTVNVTITLDNPSASGRLDQAPVNVNITDQSVHNVLAVPINALLALSEGGDGVEVVDGGTRHLVGVQTGLFSNTMVEISGPGITEGTVVEVPSS
jgi:peptidoglycan hydrolase-like protein with peptidoglycan-binding domain